MVATEKVGSLKVGLGDDARKDLTSLALFPQYIARFGAEAFWQGAICRMTQKTAPSVSRTASEFKGRIAYRGGNKGRE